MPPRFTSVKNRSAPRVAVPMETYESFSIRMEKRFMRFHPNLKRPSRYSHRKFCPLPVTCMALGIVFRCSTESNRFRVQTGAIIHSDRGSQSSSTRFRKLLSKKGLRQSMGGWRNAASGLPVSNTILNTRTISPGN